MALVECKLCGRKFKQITITHLKRAHQISFQEYIEMFPEAELFSDERREANSKALTGRVYSEDTIKKMSDAAKGRIAWNKSLSKDTDPRVAKYANAQRGKTISQEARKKMSESKKKAFANGTWKPWLSGLSAKDDPRVARSVERLQAALWKKQTPEWNEKVGTKRVLEFVSGKRKIPPVQKGYGYRKDLGHEVRGRWEANFARVLKYLNISYEYESEVFLLTKSNGRITSYTPDFKISNCFIEIKTYFGKVFNEKYDLFKKQYSDLNISVVDEGDYRRIEVIFSGLVDGWEFSNANKNKSHDKQ